MWPEDLGESPQPWAPASLTLVLEAGPPPAPPPLRCAVARGQDGGSPGLTPRRRLHGRAQGSWAGGTSCANPRWLRHLGAVVVRPQSGLQLLNPPCFSCSPFPSGGPCSVWSGGSAGSPQGSTLPARRAPPETVSTSLIVFSLPGLLNSL